MLVNAAAPVRRSDDLASALFRTIIFNFYFIKFIHNERKNLKRSFMKYGKNN